MRFCSYQYKPRNSNDAIQNSHVDISIGQTLFRSGPSVKRGSPVLCCTDRVVDMSTLPLCLTISDKYLAQTSNLVHDGTQLMWYVVVVHHHAAIEHLELLIKPISGALLSPAHPQKAQHKASRTSNARPKASQTFAQRPSEACRKCAPPKSPTSQSLSSRRSVMAY